MSLQSFGDFDEFLQEREWVWIIRFEQLIVNAPCYVIHTSFGLYMKTYHHIFVHLQQISFYHFECKLLFLLIHL